MAISRTYRKRGARAIVSAIISLFFSITSYAEVSTQPETREPERLQLVSGKPIILKSDKPVRRISEPDPEIAEALIISPHQIYITAKAAGTTNLILWQSKNDFSVYDLEVVYDISRLKRNLAEVLPNEKDLRVVSTQDSITLWGRISSTSNLSQALSLAEAYAPEGKIRNLLEVGGVHQVMLEIRVAEMSKSLLKRLGVNMHYSRGGDFGVLTLGGLAQIPVSPFDANMLVGPLDNNPALYAHSDQGALVSSTVNALFRFHHNGATWTNFIDALEQDGLAKILAEPTLVAMSGQSASFLAGGEYPIPVPQGDGDITIDYKEFGVKLSFTPTVMSDNKISIKVTPEVSDLDFSTAVQFSGFVVPGITTRKVSTTVELADGQSFAIAGLLNESVREVVNKYPILGDIPILGNLFRSRSFQKRETELIIIATPHLVKPLNMEEQTLPTDYYIEPNDTESYILGLSEGREKDKDQLSKNEAKLDGDFGHAMPDSR